MALEEAYQLIKERLNEIYECKRDAENLAYVDELLRAFTYEKGINKVFIANTPHSPSSILTHRVNNRWSFRQREDLYEKGLCIGTGSTKVGHSPSFLST